MVGEFKQGKSSLVNALVGREICPVDDDIATAVPTAVRWADEATASVLFHPVAEDEASNATDETGAAEEVEPPRTTIRLDEIESYVVEQPGGNSKRVLSVDVGVPCRVLRNGLVIVDTPGVGGLGSLHSTVTAGALPMAEAVIFVSDASQEFTAPEIDFMRSAYKLCPNLVCVMTKIDFYPAWRKIRDINEAHLIRLGIEADILAVSSTVYATAMKTGKSDSSCRLRLPGSHQLSQKYDCRPRYRQPSRVDSQRSPCCRGSTHRSLRGSERGTRGPRICEGSGCPT